MYGRDADKTVTLFSGQTFSLKPMGFDEIPDWMSDAMPHLLSHVVGTRDIAGWSVRDERGTLVGYIFKRGAEFHAEYVSQRDGDWYVARPHRNRFDAAVAAIARGRADEMYWMKKRAEVTEPGEQRLWLQTAPGDYDAEAPEAQMSLFHEPDRCGTLDLLEQLDA